MAEGDPLKTAPYEKRWLNARESISSFDGKNARLTKPWLGTISEQVALFDIRPDHVTGLATASLEGAAMEWWHDYKSNRDPPVTASTLSFENFSAALSGRFAIAPDLDPRDRMLQMTWKGQEDPSLFAQRFTQIVSEAQPPVDQHTQVYVFLNKLPKYVQQRVRAGAPMGRFQTLQEVQSAALSVWSTEQLRDLHLASDSDTGSDNSNNSKRRRFGNAGPSRMGGSASAADTNKPVVAGRSGSTSLQGDCNRCGNRGHKRSDCPEATEPKN